jgi:glycosyltransferase involved in cell wall biosynthesis
MALDKGLPLVSVLLPVYNGEEYLAEAIQSILDQTYKRFELIIINDGSSDRSAEIIRSFRDDRITALDQENCGLASTLNRAISMARGKYLARQDQDDISLPQRFEKQVAFLDSHPEYGMVGTWAEIWDNIRKTERVHRHPVDSLTLKFELLFNNPFVHSSMMIRKAAIEKVGMYSTDKLRQPPEDYELWSRMARYYEIANIPETLLIYREVPKSMSRMGTNPFLDKLLQISAENIAFAAERAHEDNLCKNLAALAHSAYAQFDSKLKYRTLADIMYKAASRLCTSGMHQKDCALTKQARYRMWTMWLRYVMHRYLGFTGQAVCA